jgi:membrane-bound metal-dependent hydrolase YbcI (DUF457 family)
MPFTPFHWGPASCIGLTWSKGFDFPTLLTATTVIDFEPLLVLVLALDYPAHGFFHSFVGSSLLAVVTGIIMYFLRDNIKEIMADFKLQQDSSFKKILWSSFFGFYFHILLDSLIYKEMNPFYPLKGNPLYTISPLYMYVFCGGSLLAALFLYAVRSQRKDDLLILLNLS